MTDHEYRDVDYRDLDTLLSESAPTTSQDGPVRAAALEAMARDARPSRRNVRRPLAIGAGAFALVLAGGMAAGAAFDWHVPWANEAPLNYAYTLPSGAQCSGIMGNVKGPPDAVAAANAFLGRPDLLQVIDINAAIASLREGPDTYARGDGSQVDAGPGTPYWTPDYEYELAFGQAVQAALWDALASDGYSLSDMSMEGVGMCPGAQVPASMDTAGD